MRKTKLPAKVKTVEDLLALDEWHVLLAGLAEQSERAVGSIILVRDRAGDLHIAGTVMPDAEALLMLEEAKQQILEWRRELNS